MESSLPPKAEPDVQLKETTNTNTNAGTI